MSNNSIFRSAVVALAIGVGGVFTVDAEEVGLENMTLQQVQSRISALEAEMVAVITAQTREKHQAEYNDQGAVPQRVEAKKLEKELLDARSAYDERLRVLDEGYRVMEADIKRRYKEIKDFRGLAAALEREISFAERGTNEAAAAQLAVLTAEAEQGRAQLVQAQADLDRLNRELNEKKKAIAATDKRAGKMAAEIADLADRHAKALAALNQSVDGKEEIVQFDDRRRQILDELDVLRYQRDKLTRAVLPVE